MTIVEKAAYLRGLAEGLGLVPDDSAQGRLWAALSELLGDMAHEIEDLQRAQLDTAEAVDELAERLYADEDEDEDEEEDDAGRVLYDAACPFCGEEIRRWTRAWSPVRTAASGLLLIWARQRTTKKKNSPWF